MDEYEKKYKDAMARLELVTRTGLKIDPTYIFPELAESKDEKIKKKLIKLLRNLFNNYSYFIKDPFYTECINWLEKQGEQKLAISDDALREGISHFGITQYQIDNWLKKYVDVEKQDKQKHTDTGEPKFKVGDWIINRTNAIIMQIINNTDFYESVEIGGQRRTDSYNYVEWDFRLWSIEDAKDGDVLFKDLMGGMTFIFDGVDQEMAILYSFIISNDGGRIAHYNIGKPNTGIGYVEENKNIIHPATKEQRELLFSKMKESGYVFDAEKKKLKEFNPDDLIEESYQQQADDLINMVTEKSTWSEEDEEKFRDVIRLIEQGAPVQTMRDHYTNWLKLLKDRVQPQPKQEWSEEDEHRVKDAIYFLETAKKHYASDVVLNACIDWLETLKERLKGE